ncbi:Gfo/Idh/MocA family protein [Caldibacillus debilis]|uniref:Gfo/Idh/MocA family protein n=1 Tax=Caldibacillus debilis TaxID=301148 RepID=UPI0023F58DA5|nr:Gfo/Idh/MocA family oxidoreductase [Caldibacillus debilis]
MRFRVGIIGIGSIVEEVHLPVLAKRKDVILAAACDVNEERLKEISRKYSVPKSYRDGLEMIAREKLDAVVICTPNSAHIPYAAAAAAKGIHIFLEKPIGVNPQEAEDMIRTAGQNRAIVMVGMVSRFRRDVQIAKEYIESGMPGDIYYVKAQLLRRRGTPKGWFTDRSFSGGGVLMDIGVHVLDAAWWLLGCPRPQRISGHAVQALGNYETRFLSSWKSSGETVKSVHDVEDFAAGWIRFENGTVLALETSWALNGKQDEGLSMQIYGTKGGISLPPLTLYREERRILSEIHPQFEENHPYEEEFQHFFECIRKGKTPVADGVQGLRVLEMIRALYESARQGRELSL